MQQKTCDPCVYLFVYNTSTYTVGTKKHGDRPPSVWICDAEFVTVWCLFRGWQWERWLSADQSQLPLIKEDRLVSFG